MTDTDTPQAPGPKPQAPVVLRVGEGPTSRRMPPERTFSVTLDRPASDHELAVVATARHVVPERRDGEEVLRPATVVEIPAPGSPHPTVAGYVARPPMIFPVGLRQQGGAMLADRTNFYNLRVKYVKETPGSSPQAPAAATAADAQRPEA